MSLELIKKKIRAGEFYYRMHIYDKLEEINNKFLLRLTTNDVELAILNGELVETLDNDERGKRYVIEGCVAEGTLLETVRRIENDVVIITVYLPDYF